MTYKLRAECNEDVQAFIELYGREIEAYKLEREAGYPDINFQFDTALLLPDIIERLREVEEGDVMYQTVQPLELFTGERNYDL